jgi:hypothetical protein
MWWALWGEAPLPPSLEQRRECWLRSQCVDVGHVVRVLPAEGGDREEVLFLTAAGEPRHALIEEDWEVELADGW